jgi:hypothetical protein
MIIGKGKKWRSDQRLMPWISPPFSMNHKVIDLIKTPSFCSLFLSKLVLYFDAVAFYQELLYIHYDKLCQY